MSSTHFEPEGSLSGRLLTYSYGMLYIYMLMSKKKTFQSYLNIKYLNFLNIPIWT